MKKNELIQGGVFVWVTGLVVILLSLAFASYSLSSFCWFVFIWTVLIGNTVMAAVVIDRKTKAKQEAKAVQETDQQAELEALDEKERRNSMLSAKDIFAKSKWRLRPFETWKWKGEDLWCLYDDGWDVAEVSRIPQEALPFKGTGCLMLESVSPTTNGKILEAKMGIPQQHPILEKLFALKVGSVVEFEYHEEPVYPPPGAGPAAYLTMRNRPVSVQATRSVH